MVYWQVKISNAAAVLADEVMMRQSFGLEPIIAASEVEFACQSLFHENPQVPIHRAQTKVWELLSYLLENPSSRGMTFGLSKDLQYSIALSALAGSVRHAPTDTSQVDSY
jgi:hypothetical protein